MELDSVPVVDFSAFSLEKKEPDQEKFPELIDEVYNAFAAIGFMYLKNTGLPSNIIDNVFTESRNFFRLDETTKMEFRRGEFRPISGYIGNEAEGLNPERPHKDRKEVFNLRTCEITSKDIEKKEVSDFVKALEDVHAEGSKIALRVLEIMARGLGLDDPQFFVKTHSACQGNVRSVHYPPMDASVLKEGQTRCGEHSDYGSLSLIFQGETAGLEIRDLNGEWRQARPIEDTVLVIIGDFMQRLTADKLIATKHRVMPPPLDKNGGYAGRNSVIVFGDPDLDMISECIEGSDKYPPIKFDDYLNMKYNQIY